MTKSQLKATINKLKILLALVWSVIFIPNTLAALDANFTLKAQYSRNKKIWGTYKLKKEKLSIIRGKKKWFKNLSSRVGDIIITNGHIIFIRETKQIGKTKIIVDKIPYKLGNDGIFLNRDPLDNDEGAGKGLMDRLYGSDLKAITPHLDLLKGTIQYKKIKCTKKRGTLECILKGFIHPHV